jgi:hypothetical protein
MRFKIDSTSKQHDTHHTCPTQPVKPVRNAGVTTLLAGVLATACAQGARAYTPPPSDFFPIGTWLQPMWTFDTWKARGVNTVVGYWPDPSQTIQQWDAAAAQKGLYEVRAAQANPAWDVNIKNLLAWAQPDEPDWKQITPASLAATYSTLKKIDPQRPVYMNVVGSMALNPWIAKDGSLYKTLGQSADIISNDIYPVSIWNRPEWIDFSKPLNPGDPYNTTGKRLNPGAAIDVLRPWVGGKKQWAYIETSWQGPFPTAGTTGVNPSQMRGEVWDAIIHGAKGITYFPEQVTGGSKIDNTPANVATEITKVDSVISSLAGIINSGNDATNNTVSFNNPYLEGTWRTYKGQKYLFVLNMSSATLSGKPFTTSGLTGLTSLQVVGEHRSETLSLGSISDEFQPYQLHVYTTAGATVGTGPIPPAVGASVPEPASGMLLAAGLGAGLMKRRRRETIR